jgi:hypothetical protein
MSESGSLMGRWVGSTRFVGTLSETMALSDTWTHRVSSLIGNVSLAPKVATIGVDTCDEECWYSSRQDTWVGIGTTFRMGVMSSVVSNTSVDAHMGIVSSSRVCSVLAADVSVASSADVHKAAIVANIVSEYALMDGLAGTG